MTRKNETLEDAGPLSADEELLERSPSQRDLLVRVRRLGIEAIGPAAIRIDREARYPHEAIDALKAAGLPGLCVPLAEGGGGAGYRGDVELLPLVLMELASWCSSTSQVFALHNTGVQLVHAMGDAEQRRFFFAEALSGHLFASFGSEAGADRTALASVLTRAEGGYLLNGRKIFATGSPGAKWAFWRSVSAEAAGSQDDRYMMPVVGLFGPGVTVIDDWDGIGQRGTGSGKVEAADVFVPDAHVMGGPGAYGAHAAYFAAQFHINFAAQFVGMAAGALREALAYVRERARPWPGVPSAAEDPYTLLRVGDMSTRIAGARELVLRAARLLGTHDGGPELRRGIRLAASQAKIAATDAALEVTGGVFQVMGARAATRECGIDRFYRNARTLTLHDPVDRQRETAGREELAAAARWTSR
ncbi:acyl-CoA dehydrogenase family protein [Cohnella sp. GCM10020058]|uniref:acyl-CoA dehydrogenase family protein n=1 Tax=Cohnella sp. GCM10020058 TaxID=3317330 RepID=UPI003635FAF2